MRLALRRARCAGILPLALAGLSPFAHALRQAGPNPANAGTPPATVETIETLPPEPLSLMPMQPVPVQPAFEEALPAVLPKPVTPLTSDEQILQLLNRLTYGPRPGDLERVRAEGVKKWLSDQLNPQRIDDGALERRLAAYPAMQLPVQKLLEQYPDSAEIRAAAAGRVGVPFSSAEHAIYEAQMERYREKRTKGGDAKEGGAEPAPLPVAPAAILDMRPDDRFKLLTKLTPEQLRRLHRELSDPQRAQLLAGFSPRQTEMLAALASPAGLVGSEVVQTKLLRSIYSERQLQEVMVDFWVNHFNVYIKKNQLAPYLIVSFERDTIRPHALGHFENLLVATASSPAMLSYLDNASSVGPHSSSVEPNPAFERFGTRPAKNAASGLNENYARELMELHTLGVNGGYTQKDVTEVARVFTGWTIGRGYDGGEATHAEFDPGKHEPGDKMVLGVKIKQDGEREGMQVLHLLATSPETAHFISSKLAIRFVSDTPPPAMIERMAKTFLETQGDIRQVLLTMLLSPEFFAREIFRAKVKTPQDYVISAVRASGADVESAGALTAAISDLGMPLYGMQTPNGYSMRADPWNSTASLIARMNFALALATNRVAGVHTDWPAVLAPGSGQAVKTLDIEAKDKLLEDRLLHVPVSARTRATILSQMSLDPAQQRASLNQVAGQKSGRRDPLSSLRAGEAYAEAQADGALDPQTALAAGLLFGSPEFQRR